MGVSNLTININNQADWQVKRVRQRKTLLKEGEGLTGADSAETSSSVSVVPVIKRQRAPSAGQEKKTPWVTGRVSTSYAHAVESSL
jgi:hypothetical protein